MPGPYALQMTLQYKTFVKRALVEALQAAFTGHADPTVASAKVATDFTETDFALPALIVKFYESELMNAGVGHFEWFPPDPTQPTILVEYQHRLYKGTIEFEIFGLSSLDRDILSDALIEVLAMDEVSAPGLNFLNRFYTSMASTPSGQWHFPTLNLDNIEGYGEQSMLAPWAPEDTLVYQTAYRVGIFGEFYSLAVPTTISPLTEVDVYGYPVGANNVTPIDPTAPAPPVDQSKYEHYKGWPPGAATVKNG